MYWMELERALLYGQPPITNESLQPETLKAAVREIVRLVNFGWVDDLSDDMLQRIQAACRKCQCPEIWEEFRYEKLSSYFYQREKKH